MSISDKSKKITFSQNLARGILKVFGWQVVGTFPDLPKYILVGAPHTSNWDFPLAMLLMYASRVRFHWIGKASLFKGPLAGLFRRLRGIPVRRDQNKNFVTQIVDIFNQSERLIIAIAPEGTRKKSTYWKTGFYYMALGAQVPVVLGFVDYLRKQVGVGPVLHPTGDIQIDFAQISAFYAEKVGLHPKKQGVIEIHPA